MKDRLLIRGILLAGLFLCAGPAAAQYERGTVLGPMITPDVTDAEVPAAGTGEWDTSPGRIHFGRLRILPSLALFVTYDDNIFLGSGSDTVLVTQGQAILDEARIADEIFQLTPGLSLSLPFKGQRGKVAVGYLGDFAIYTENPDNNWIRNQASLNFEYKAPQGLILGLNNGFVDTNDPFGSLDQYQLGRKKSRWYNDLETKAGYQFSNRFRTFVYYGFYNQDYKHIEDFTQDYREMEMGPGFEVRVMPKTWAFVRYHYGFQDYYKDYLGVTSANNANNDWHRVNVGLTWDATSKLTGELNVGWKWVRYKNAVDPQGQLYQDKSLPIVATALNYLVTPESLLSLYVSREWRESGSSSPEAFASTGVGLNFNHRFFRKYQVRAGFGYQNDDYNINSFNWFTVPYYDGTKWLLVRSPAFGVVAGTDDQNDNNFSGELGFSWQLQEWLQLGVAYNFYSKNSNYDQFDFTDNKGTVWVRAAY